MPTYAELITDIQQRIQNKTEAQSIENTDVSTPMIDIVNKLQEVAGVVGGNIPVLANIAALEGFEGANDLVFVQGDRGGFFQTGSGTVDNGIVFSHSISGQWIRVYDKARGVNVKWFGAVGDGVADDLTALVNAMRATVYLDAGTKLVFPDGVFRITDTWTLGYKAVNEDELFDYSAYEAPSYLTNINNEDYLGRKPKQIDIVGSRNTWIYGDFESVTWKAIVYHGIRIRLGRSDMAGKIENIKIAGKGKFNGSGAVVENYADLGTTKNQIGFVSVFQDFGRMEGFYICNCRQGYLVNASYGLRKNNFFWRFCETAYFDRSSSLGYGANFHARNCNLGYRLQAAYSNFIDLWGEHNLEDVWVQSGRGIRLDNLYCEKAITDGAEVTYRVKIGYDASDPNYSPTQPTVDNLTISNFAISSYYSPSGTNGNALLIQASTGKVKFQGAFINGDVGSTVTALYTDLVFDQYDSRVVIATPAHFKKVSTQSL